MVPLWTSLSTTTSPALTEFVLELGGLRSEFTQPSLRLWGNWDAIDGLFDGFLDSYPEFTVVVRTGRLYNREEFQAQAKERFPLMTKRDRVRFETSPAVDEYWS